MDVAEHIDALAEQGALLAAAAETAGPAAAVPSCPGWTVRDLVRHIGGVHGWAAAHVREAAPAMIGTDLEELVGGWPDDDDLVAWFRTSHSDLVATLRSAPADLRCATFLAAPSPLAMWSRRQAHETTIHRVDAELAAGSSPTPVPSELAADGIDELLTCFITRPQRGPRRELPYLLRIAPTDVATTWSITVSTGDVEVARSPSDDVRSADAVVSGPASQLHLLLWNRTDRDGVTVAGDRSLLDHWRSEVRVRWR